MFWVLLVAFALWGCWWFDLFSVRDDGLATTHLSADRVLAVDRKRNESKAAVADYKKDELVDIERKTRLSRGEAECGRVLAQLFPKHAFISVRPDWLMNDYPGRKTPLRAMELDCYCEALNLAIEFNGQQHYFFVSKFHKSQDQFYGQLARDRLKRDLCRRRGVDLITVRYDVPNIFEYLSTHPLILKRLPRS